jgi:hypothetical protein
MDTSVVVDSERHASLSAQLEAQAHAQAAMQAHLEVCGWRCRTHVLSQLVLR